MGQIAYKLLRALNFPDGSIRFCKAPKWYNMSESVIPYPMAIGMGTLRHLFAVTQLVAENKKRRLNAVALKNIKHSWRYVRIWTVIERKRHFAHVYNGAI